MGIWWGGDIGFAQADKSGELSLAFEFVKAKTRRVFARRLQMKRGDASLRMQALRL
jgi:hypothetical protein